MPSETFFEVFFLLFVAVKKVHTIKVAFTKVERKNQADEKGNFQFTGKKKVEGPFVLKAAAFVKVCWVKCSYLLVLPAKGLFIRLRKVANVTMHLGHPKTYKKTCKKSILFRTFGLFW